MKALCKWQHTGSVLLIMVPRLLPADLGQGPSWGMGGWQSQLGPPTLSDCSHEAEGRPEKAKQRKENPSKFSVLPQLCSSWGI